MQKSHDETSKKLVIKIILVSVVMGLALLVYDYITTQRYFDNTIQRKTAGSGNISKELIVDFFSREESIDVHISEQKLSKKEVQQKFELAQEEIDRTYLGKNSDANNVQYDLNLQDSYVEGLVKAEWKFDDYSVIRLDGTLNPEEISEDGNLVQAQVKLSYFDYEEIYSFSIMVKRLDLTSYEGQCQALRDALAEADEKTITKKYLKLPEEVAGTKLKWKAKMDFRGLIVILLGIVSAILVVISKKQELLKQEKKHQEELLQDYPLIVSELSILMGAGMSFRGALERMATNYKKKLKQNNGVIQAGYEEILMTYRQIIDGVGELTAIENLGNRTSQKDYRRLSMMIRQSIQKGSKELLDNLEKEENHAFEMRKQRAIKLGEEASTKLLLPMGGMLLIVIVILVVPALMQMQV